MILLTFRFYGALNDFLPFAYRHRRFTYSRPATSSVKDAIEALGVPHPEADVIVINGRDEDFSYRLQDGDHVAVYPPFRSIDVSSLRRVGGDPPAPVRFVVDVHLARLAAFLRLCGFDTLVDGDDAEVAGIGARDARVVLTRDVGLLKRAIVRYGHWVRDTDPERQLAEVLARFGLADQLQPFTRCLRCNTTLARIDADVVADSAARAHAGELPAVSPLSGMRPRLLARFALRATARSHRPRETVAAAARFLRRWR